MPHDHVIAVGQVFRPASRDLLLDLGCEEGIEARSSFGFALDLEDSGAILPRLREAHAARDCRGIMLRHRRLEPRPPLSERGVVLLSQRNTGYHQRENNCFQSRLPKFKFQVRLDHQARLRWAISEYMKNAGHPQDLTRSPLRVLD